jgi:hypothetical protein
MIDKWKPKPISQLPPGMEQLLQFALSSIRDCSGVNLELLGQADREQPGILEHQRKQAALTILAVFFDSLRHYRKDQGKLLLFYITKYLSDGRLIRIAGQDSAKYVPLVRQQDTVRYDVIVDDTPTSVNIKEQTWMALQQVMPFLKDAPLPPQAWLEMFKYSPLPSALITDVTAMMQKQQASPPPNPEMMKVQGQMQLETMKLQGQQKIEDTRLQIEQSKQQNDQLAEIRELKMDMLKFALEMKAEKERFQQQAKLDTMKAHHEMATDMVKHAKEQKVQVVKAAIDAKTKRDVAEINAKNKPKPKGA